MYKFDRLSEKELTLISDVVDCYTDIDNLKNDISLAINTKMKEKKTSLNVRFNMDMFIELHIFDPFEFKVIKQNNINNLQELIDCDLDSLVGITPSVKKGLEWVRKFYNMEKK